MAGVSWGARLADIRKAWQVPIHVLHSFSGSNSYAIAALCVEEQHGMLHFTSGHLDEMDFFGGTLTDRGVGIGSTRTQLRQAYGARVELRDTGSNYYEAFRVTSTGARPRKTIDFYLNTSVGRVEMVSYGLRERSTDYPAEGAAGIDC